MWNLSKMLSAFWGILGLITICTLFIVYANFPDVASLEFLNLNINFELDPHRFFFIFCGLYLVVNLTIYLAIRSANNLSKINRTIQSQQHLKTMVAVKLLACGANIFFITLMIYSKSAIEAQSLVHSGHWALLMAGPLVMVLGLIYLFYVLMFPHREIDTLH